VPENGLHFHSSASNPLFPNYTKQPATSYGGCPGQSGLLPLEQLVNIELAVGGISNARTERTSPNFKFVANEYGKSSKVVPGNTRLGGLFPEPIKIPFLNKLKELSHIILINIAGVSQHLFSHFLLKVDFYDFFTLILQC
jgi:hypothetical protein